MYLQYYLQQLLLESLVMLNIAHNGRLDIYTSCQNT